MQGDWPRWLSLEIQNIWDRCRVDQGDQMSTSTRCTTWLKRSSSRRPREYLSAGEPWQMIKSLQKEYKTGREHNASCNWADSDLFARDTGLRRIVRQFGQLDCEEWASLLQSRSGWGHCREDQGCGDLGIGRNSMGRAVASLATLIYLADHGGRLEVGLCVGCLFDQFLPAMEFSPTLFRLSLSQRIEWEWTLLKRGQHQAR